MQVFLPRRSFYAKQGDMLQWKRQNDRSTEMRSDLVKTVLKQSWVILKALFLTGKVTVKYF